MIRNILYQPYMYATVNYIHRYPSRLMQMGTRFNKTIKNADNLNYTSKALANSVPIVAKLMFSYDI